eukprot:contig_4993_g1093
MQLEKKVAQQRSTERRIDAERSELQSVMQDLAAVNVELQDKIITADERARLVDREELLSRSWRMILNVLDKLYKDVAKLEQEIEELQKDIAAMRASPLAAALSRMGIVRSPSASRVAVSDMVFEPTPAKGFFGKPVVEKECEQLWADIKNYVLDHHLQPGHTDDAKLSKEEQAARRFLLYILGSPGRGKTLYLREALRFYWSRCLGETRDERLLELSPFIVSFNGLLTINSADARLVKLTGQASILLYTRLIFCAQAELGDKPSQSFQSFLTAVERDLVAKRSSLSVIQDEVDRLVTERCGGRRMVLFVDELNKLGPEAGGADVCMALGADARELVRSEACRLASTSGYGSAVFTSLDQGVMDNESSASGRPCRPVGVLQTVDAEKHLPMMLRVLSAQEQPQPPSQGESKFATWSFRVGCTYASLSGGHWRAAERLAEELARAPAPTLVKLCSSVHEKLPATLTLPDPSSGELYKKVAIKDLSSPDLRVYVDHVLAAVVLQETVRRDDYILPGAADVRPSGASPSKEGVLEIAKRRYVDRHNAVLNARWDLFGRQGFITVAAVDSFEPDIIPLSLVAILNQPGMRASPMTQAVGRLVDVALLAGKAAMVGTDIDKGLVDALEIVGVGALGTCDGVTDEAKGADDKTVASTDKSHEHKDDEGAGAGTPTAPSKSLEREWYAWERFVVQWISMMSVARSVRPSAGAPATLHNMYGAKATWSGEGPILRRVRVNASVAQGRVVVLDKSLFGKDPVTLQRVVERYPVEQLFRTVFLFPTNYEAVDAVCFHQALDAVDGVVKVGDAMPFFWQFKRSGIYRVTSTAWSEVRRCVERLDKADSILGDSGFCALWRPRCSY